MPNSEAFLSTSLATNRERRLALAAVVLSVLVFVATAPFAKVQLAPLAAFIPTYQSALVVSDLITAVLLFSQFRFLRSRALLVLATGYLFTGLIAACHALTFPGLFAPGGLLGAGPQSTAWLYMFWHAGFPGFVIAYALLKDEGRETRIGIGSAAAAACAAAIAMAAVFTLTATSGQNALPPIMQGNRYTPAMVVVVSSVWGLSLVALLVLWRRRPHSLLDLWLMVVMCAWLFDIALSAVLNAGRFDLGFYAGRIYGLVAATLVLVVLLLENGALYAQLVKTRASEREEHRQAQTRASELVAMNNELEVARQAALSADRAKSAFLATMSHEIRTPMNGVMGMLELLALGRLEPDQRNQVSAIRESAHSLLRIIDDLLDFSKIEAGRLDLAPEPTSITQVVESVYQTYAGAASSRNLRLQQQVDARISPAVMVDPLRLRQILNNLVSNAIKFTEKGEVALAARLLAREEGHDLILFTVRDTGVGIAKENQQKLFEPFVQAETQTSRRFGGTGLGLSICRKLAQMMGGKIEMQSEAGAGTTMSVTLRLPIASAAATPVAAGPKAAGAQDVRVRECPSVEAAERDATLVLVADDHPINRQVLQRQLERIGYASEAAEDGREALGLWRTGRFALLLSDCHMPELDGYQLARTIRADEAAQGTARKPIIACTANALAGEAEQCLAAGMDDYLAKPVQIATLAAKLQAWLPLASGPTGLAKEAQNRS